MSKHRRTKSNGNYYQINHEFLVKDDDFEFNETKLIIEKIQKMTTRTQQIVEKLEENPFGLYNDLFNFGKQHIKKKSDLNLSQISECSSTHSSEFPNLKLRNQTITSPICIHTQHSQRLQQTIQYLEQEIEQMKVKQGEMRSVNMFLLKATQKNRQEFVKSQKKNEQMMKQLMQKLEKDQSNAYGSTSEGLD